jgi:type II restriction enzyme
MATDKQKLGEFGEIAVVKHCACPKCKRIKSLRRLPVNFKCADLICDFCGYLAQVKAKTVKDTQILPKQILGAAWGPQRARMEAGIYFPLYLVLKTSNAFAIYYLSADLQPPEMFVAREPLSQNARRAGWQGFYYDLSILAPGAMVKVF